ncbi:alpha-2-macroglobulin family protein [Agaribacterium haliotis]|uniref:alpha-2-macroglobulin family protein n=1 Tax=Agaribacterium haliotis TaxID=2013869 RepID=UPI000BB588E8|nr:MG2 domain-containing protein [Agaribacterium haliotis]
MFCLPRASRLLCLALLIFFTACSKSPSENSDAASAQEGDTTATQNARSQTAEQISAQTKASAELVSTSGNDRWSAHIKKQPASYVSASRPLSIVFSHPVSGEQALNEALDGLLSFEPELRHRAFFSQNNRIEIELLEPLAREQNYTLLLFPNKLDGVSDKLGAHQIPLKALRQDFSLQIDGLHISRDSGEHTISGSLHSNDAISPAQAEALLSARQGQQILPVSWVFNSDSNAVFIVKNIQRLEQASSVELSWNGQGIGVDKTGRQQVKVPSMASFEVTAIRSEQTSEQWIYIDFSEALLRKQNADALVLINGKAARSVRIDGNRLRVSPAEKLSGSVQVEVLAGVRSASANRSQQDFKQQLEFLTEKPAVRFVGDKHILAQQEQLNIAIEAVNVDSVQVTAYRLPENNLGAFLQYNNLRQSYIDDRSSSALWRRTFSLPEIPRDRWQSYVLDLSDLFIDARELIAVQIKIDRSNSILECGSERPEHNDKLESRQWPNEQNQNQPSWVQRYYLSQGYGSWRDRDNPCTDYYFSYHSNDASSLRYFSHSNIGLIAKLGGDRQLLLTSNDIGSAEPLRDVEIIAYNFQNQALAEGKTDKNGMLTLQPVAAPHYVIARKNGQLSFLRLQRNEALSSNVFDVGGAHSSTGLKGFFYGERGVWRPGDDIYLNFIAEDKSGNFQADQALTLDFFDPRGSKQQSLTQASPVGGFYHFKLKTDDDAATGNWRAVIRYGNQYFSKIIPVEAIVPNRLKIELDFPAKRLSANNNGDTIKLHSQWLNGATAKQLKSDVKLVAQSVTTKIAGFDGFIFDDPSRTLKSQERIVFDGKLDQHGDANFIFQANIYDAPGEVKLNFTSRVFEPGGNFSTQYRSINYLPYKQLVGLNVPSGSGWNNSIARDEKHELSILATDAQGRRLADNKVELQLYRIDWRWWWDYGSENLSSYVNGSHNRALSRAELQTNNDGLASWVLDGNNYDWGRYLIRSCHSDSGHCAGKVVYLGWSAEANSQSSGESQLIISSDKDSYEPGDTAWLNLPQLPDSKQARLLLSLENGSGVIEQRWVENEVQDRRLAIDIDASMAPNIYAPLSLIQALDNKNNDSPVRMYGIVPLKVNNKNSKLQPQLTSPKSVRPQSSFEVSVSEKLGRSMSYTLALVDEGLLGITNFKLPDAHLAFYQREALGVLTWDIYDLIAEQKSAQFNSLLRLGGGDKGDDNNTNKKRRFPPVVQHLGPFTLAAGQTNTHSIQLPEYIGAVRLMLVAAEQVPPAAKSGTKSQVNKTENAYGSAEQSITVTQPLTLLATLPRVLGPNEDLDLPISVFANTDSIKDVQLKIEANELFELKQNQLQLSFNKQGEQIVSVPLRSRNQTGTGTVTVSAISGTEKISQSINIPVRSAALPETVSDSALLEAGQSQLLEVEPNGMLNSNQAWFELSRFPELKLGERLDYLIAYPHGCLEQTTSRLFPQLYLDKLVSLSDKQKQDIDLNVREGIQRLKRFQQNEGAFNYWPGGHYSNRWANSYAGHFLIEAKKLGYVVPTDMFERWLAAQKTMLAGNTQKNMQSSDAYALYTLALAGAADFNHMNRLREQLRPNANKNQETPNLRLARWLLAAAYSEVGVEDAASELMQAANNRVQEYPWSGYTYGSELRDSGILLYVLSRLSDKNHNNSNNNNNNNSAAWDIALDIAEQMRQQRWYSTQSVAWALLGFGDYFSAASSTEQQDFSYRIGNGDWQKSTLMSPIYKQPLDVGSDKLQLEIRNDSQSELHISLNNQGRPAISKQPASASRISLSTEFRDLQGQSLDIKRLPQGEDFKAIVKISALDNSTRLENLALSVITPSGWQIANDRLEGKQLAAGLEYQDFRDDRVLSYFSLGRYYHYQRYDKRSIELEFTLNASFAGRFYLPAWQVEAMYDNKIKANNSGQWVQVVAEAGAKNQTTAVNNDNAIQAQLLQP